MEDTDGTRPAEPVAAETAPADVAVTSVVPPSAGPPLAIFLGILLLLIASFGGSALVLAGAGRVSDEPDPTATPTITSAPGRTAGAAATATGAAAGRVRVVNTSARSRPIASGAEHEVTFTWTLQGAREGDQVVVQFYSGTQSLGQQRGVLDPQVFNFSTGTLTLPVTMECSTGGWSAEILTVRGQPIEGESEAKASGVQCPR
jgi:hypothetical protein